MDHSIDNPSPQGRRLSLQRPPRHHVSFCNARNCKRRAGPCRNSTRPSSNRTTPACPASVTSKRTNLPKRNRQQNQPLTNSPPSADVTPCNTMQHDSQICDDVAARDDERKYLPEKSKRIRRTPSVGRTLSVLGGAGNLARSRPSAGSWRAKLALTANLKFHRCTIKRATHKQSVRAVL
jgi:hypothetical protein